MKPKVLIASLLSVVLLLGACSGEPSENTDVQTTTVQATEAVETEEDPVPLELAESVECTVKPVYKEAETNKSGEVKINNIKLKVSYDSTFYGAHSAIHRPYTISASEFTAKSVSGTGDFSSQIA